MKDWRSYATYFENQIRKGGFDPQTCITSTVQSAASFILEDQYGILDTDYSIKFTAQKSRTGNNGNTIGGVIESVKNDGLVLEGICPSDDWQAPIPDFAERRGKEWKSEWLFNAKPAADPVQALDLSPVLITVFAWAFDGDAYIKPEGIKDNHVCLLLYADDEYFYVLDSYDPFIKRLRRDYKFDEAFSFSIKKRTLWNTLICR